MRIFIVDNKPCFAVPNGFKPIDDQTYYLMIENGEIDQLEVIEHD
jgi:hypothetical protein